jgi:hypothetical protein
MCGQDESELLRLSLTVTELIAKFDASPDLSPLAIGYRAAYGRRQKLARQIPDDTGTISVIPTIPGSRGRDAQTLAMWRWSRHCEALPDGMLAPVHASPETIELWREAAALRE